MTVAVYSPLYLPISQTFVYRQLQGVAERFRALVVTHRLANAERFPYAPVELCPRTLFDRVYGRMARNGFGRFDVMSRAQTGRLVRALGKHDVGLIHAHFGPAGLQMLPVAQRLGVPLLVTFHGYDASALLTSEHYCAGLKKLFAYASPVAVSQAVAERLCAAGADRLRLKVLYIGIPVDEFRYVERVAIAEKKRRGETIRFLQVARLVEKKGTEYTLKAFRELRCTHRNCTLTIAGEGPLLKKMRALAKELGIDDAVVFAGKVTTAEVVQLMGEADVCLQHSVTASNGDREGLPTVLMEAMASGLPVISTRHSGIPELIDDGVSGYLVDERDVTGYAVKLRAILRCGMEMGRRGRAVVESRFNLATQNGKLADYYHEAGQAASRRTDMNGSAAVLPENSYGRVWRAI
ncbi:MAG: glycosyltransferase [Gammaproteobacteria bacterium]